MRFDPNTVFPILIPLIVVAVLAVRPRNAKPQHLHLDRLWIMPVLMTAFIGMGLYYQPHSPFGPGAFATFVFALALGGFAGWFRARAVPMAFDAAAGRVITTPSILAILVIVVLFAVRSVVRLVLDGPGAALHLNAGAVSDAFLLFAVGLICGGRIEMYLRGSRLMRSGTAGAAA